MWKADLIKIVNILKYKFMEGNNINIPDTSPDKNLEKEKQAVKDFEVVKRCEQIRSRLKEIEERGEKISADEKSEHSVIKSELSEMEDSLPSGPVDFGELFRKYSSDLPKVDCGIKNSTKKINQLMRFPNGEFVLNEIATHGPYEGDDNGDLFDKEEAKKLLENEKSKTEKKLAEIEKMLV